MKRVLGLDLGTTSIGWAVVEQAENKSENSSIVSLGVRVNPLTVDEKGNFEKGKSITTTADRTLKRGMRRNLQRYKQRRDALIAEMRLAGMISDDTILSEDGASTTHETLRLRAMAVHSQITLEQLARVLLSINKKRGYKSNRKANNSEEGGELIDGMAVARRLHEEQITPGQLGYSELQRGRKYIPTFYASDLKNELIAIWEKQSGFHHQLSPDLLAQIEGKGKTETLRILKKALDVEDEVEKDRKSRRKTYYKWRDMAVTQKIDLPKLITVVTEINGEILSSSGYLGAISDHSKELYFKGMTVGEYMWDTLNKDPHHSFKNVIFYRQDYINEFNAIWETQSKFYPTILTDDLKKRLRDIIIFYQRRLKSQKGLISHCEFESKEITVITPEGKEKKVISGPRACPKSSPLYQEFKIWQVISNVEVNGQPLSQKQRELLYNELRWKRSLSSREALSAMEFPARGYKLNYTNLPGNTTQATLLDAYRRVLEASGHDVEDFYRRSLQEQLEFVEKIFAALGANTSFFTFNEGKDNEEMQQNAMFRLWHLLYSFEEDNSALGNERLIEKIEELTGLPHEYASIIAGTVFEQDYGSLSAKAMHRILPFMKNDGLTYDKACEKAGYRHSKHSLTREELDSRQLNDHLEQIGKGQLRNPVVEKILNQMAHVVNAVIDEYGRPDEIHIEMARSLKQTREQREKATKSINDKTRQNEDIKQKLVEEFGIPNPSRNDILRYQLYEELAPNGYKTLYSNTYIPKEKLFSRDFDIEHIIPQALLFDDSYGNKTLESRSVNIEKGDKTAFDYVRDKWGMQGADEYKNRILFLSRDIKTQRKYRNLFVKEVSGKLVDDNGKEVEGFLNRDISDTQYIARKASEMLRSVTRQVVFTTGSITDRLRQDWQLINVMKELNWDKYFERGLTEVKVDKDGKERRDIIGWSKRNDHRHHAMDAVTVAFTRLQHIQYLNSLSARGSDNDLLREEQIGRRRDLIQDGKFLPPIPLDIFRNEVKKHLQRVLVSIKAKNKVMTPNVNKVKNSSKRQQTQTPRGQLHNETVYGRRLRYVTKEEKVGATFNREKILTVARKDYREALLERLEQFNGDAKRAFTGKNSLDKFPLFIDEHHLKRVPPKVKTVTQQEYFTIRKEIGPDLKLDKVVDKKVQEILKKRLTEFGGNARQAFSNLDENPIYLNKEKGITIKRVTITGVTNATPLHHKHDKNGTEIVDWSGDLIPTDYVSTSNNHHAAIFMDEDGNLQEHVVPFYEATAASTLGVPVVDKNYNSHLGWKFLFTLKQNEYFVLPDEEKGFFPEEIDLLNPLNLPEISEHLYRVQKFSKGVYYFRHHLETNVDDVRELQGKTWVRIQSLNKLKGIVKVRLNHLGQIVATGEY